MAHTLTRGAVVPAALACALAGCGGSTKAHSGGTAAHTGGSKPAAAGRPAVATTTTVLRAAASGRLPAPVQDPATTAYGSGLLLAGGLNSADVSVSDVTLAGSAGARRAPSLAIAVHDAAATTLGGRAYVFGGGEPSKSAITSVGAGAPSAAGQLPAAASDVAAATIGGTAYVVGGYTGAAPLNTIVAWSGSGTGTVVGRLPNAVRYAAVAAVGARLVIAGGTVGTSATRAVYAFDPASRSVTRIGWLPRPLTHADAAALGGRMYVVGGRGALQGSQTSAVLAVDPASGHVSRAGHLPVALSDSGVGAVGGRIIVAGGRLSSGVSDRIFTLTPSLVAATASARAVVRRTPRRPVVYAMPALTDPSNVYAAAGRNALSPVVRGDRPLIYVPNSGSSTVDEIDPATDKIIRHFDVGGLPQHIVPSYDLRTLWVTNDMGNSLTPINPVNGVPGKPVPVEDPYNMYFTPDGRYAVVMAERLRRMDFRDAHTMALVHSLQVPTCAGVNHADYSADGRDMLVSCEFASAMIVVDVARQRVLKTIALRAGSSPQDVKLSPDGRTFYVADLDHAGVWKIDASSFKVTGLVPTGSGAHGLYPSRDARLLYVSNRGAGTVSVLSFATQRVVATWRIPGGSPDMGGVSADGRVLWLSGRYNGAIYALDTRNGKLLARIGVGAAPHGLCVWPQPGRYSLGHTGVMR